MSGGPPPVRRIAVVIPAYNAGELVCDALDSVIAQSRPADECIVVDDGSTDGTADTVADWSRRHPSLDLQLVERGHQGAAATRSAGVRAAQADLVALLDADDRLLPDALRTLEVGFEVWPDLAACFANAERLLVTGEIGSDYLTGKPVWRLPHETRVSDVGGQAVEVRRIVDGLFESLLGGSYIANGAVLVSRAAAIDAGLWSDEFPTVEDRDFWLRLSRQGAFAYSPAAVARVRYHGRNLTAARGTAAHAADAARVLQKIRRMGDELGLSAHEREATTAALGHAAERALYTSSRQGPGTFRETIATLDDGVTEIRWATPRHLARILASVFIRSKPRA